MKNTIPYLATIFILSVVAALSLCSNTERSFQLIDMVSECAELHAEKTRKEIEIINLKTEISNLRADKLNLLSTILKEQVVEDRRGFDYPNPLLPELPR